MPSKTPIPRGVKVTVFTSRNMRVDLLRRVRIVASVHRTTIEDIINQALENGLDKLERAKVVPADDDE